MYLKKSDVIVARPGSVAEYRTLPSATMLGWGFLPEADRRGCAPREEWKRRVEEAHHCSMKFQGRVEFDADWRGMIDYDSNFMESVALDLDGRPVTTWWTFKYKGNPSWFFCTNTEGYIRYLKHQIREVIASGADMLMLDCAIPTMGALYKGGCFCETCMEGFTNYLKDNLSEARWKELCVKDPDTFDYRLWLIGQGWTVQRWVKAILAGNDVTPRSEYQMRYFGAGIESWHSVDKAVEIVTGREEVPLGKEYLDYQYLMGEDLFRTLRDYARQQSGRDISISVNEPFYRPYRLFSLPFVDFYTKELMYYNRDDVNALPAEPLMACNMCEAYGTMLAGIGIPYDYHTIETEGTYKLVWYWIALTYAHGHVKLAPLRMWTDRLKDQPDFWYTARPGDYEPVYRFIRDHAELLEGFETMADTALILSYDDLCEPVLDYYDVFIQLTKANIPFRTVMAGNKHTDGSLNSSALEGMSTLLHHRESVLSGHHRQILLDSGLPVQAFSEASELPVSGHSPFTVTGAGNITVMPRVKGREIVIHLINRNFDSQMRRPCPQEFTLEIEKDFLPDSEYKAEYHQIEEDSLSPSDRGDRLRAVFSLTLSGTWGILHMKPV